MTVVDAQQRYGRACDDLERVLSAAVAQQVGALGTPERLEQRFVQALVAPLEVPVRVLVERRNEEQRIARRCPQIEVDIDDPVYDRIRRSSGQRPDRRDHIIEHRIKYIV
jgi:hypothetical protein